MEDFMLSDFHVHTEFSGDSVTPVREQIEAALQLGMNSPFLFMKFT